MHRRLLLLLLTLAQTSQCMASVLNPRLRRRDSLQERHALVLNTSLWTWGTQKVHPRRISEVPNPYEHPQSCGLPEGQPGPLCDPDHILSNRGQQKILNVFEAIQKKTQLECADGRMRGFQPALAVVQRMSKQDWVDDDKGATAREFATQLGNTWGVGDKGCNNGIMVFISIGDRYAYIKTAKAAKTLLTDNMAATVVDNMKSLLREEDYDRALLLGFLQIYDALQGRPPKPQWSWHQTVEYVYMWATIGLMICITCGPTICLILSFLFLQLLRPVAWCLDRLTDRKSAGIDRTLPPGRGDESAAGRGDESAALEAHKDLQRVQSELARDEFDQTVCPICLDVLDEGSVPLSECKHRFHHTCIARWLEAHDSCPMCRCDATIVLPAEASNQSDAYQKRLSAYLHLLQRRRPEMFHVSTPPLRIENGVFVSTYYGYDIYRDLIRLENHRQWSYTGSLDYHYEAIVSGCNDLNTTLLSGDRRPGFGGGTFSGGGGGGGGW